MKKYLQNVIIRAVCIFVLGTLLIVFADNITRWIVMLCGIAFIVPGLVAIISNLHKDADTKSVMLYPIIGIGSTLFGLVLLIWPTLFIDAMMYILAACLIFIAATQIYSLWSIQRSGIKLNISLYLLPIIELAGGIYICLSANKTSIASLPIIITGSGFILYAILELWTVRLLKVKNAAVHRLPQEDEV